MLGGDVLLDEITPNVGRWEDTAFDPLGRYLETLSRVEDWRRRSSTQATVRRSTDVRRRVREIQLHHAERLDVAHRALADGAGPRTTWRA